jgi:hypothetical protein
MFDNDDHGPSWRPGDDINILAKVADLSALAGELSWQEKVRRDLAYRLPGSNKPLKFVTLSRQQTEALINSGLTFDTYQEEAGRTAFYPDAGTITGLEYLALKLICEASELGQKVAKIRRDGNGIVSEACREALKAEGGDVLWYLARTARELGFNFSELAQHNLDKIKDRAARNVLNGDGDDR